MGRDFSRGGGRGRSSRNQGRGRGRFPRYQSNKSYNTKQPEMKFYPHGMGREQQTVTYDTVKDHIIQHVQKTYKNGHDIATSLRDLTKLDLDKEKPKRRISGNTEDDKKKIEQDGHDIMYQAEITRFLERKELLDQNLTKAYSLIYSTYCNKTMQNRIEEHPDFESTIQDDPIELLKAIKILMHDPIRAKYPYASLTESVTRLVNMKQLEDKGLLDYVKRFKQSRDIMKLHIGSELLDKFIENSPRVQRRD